MKLPDMYMNCHLNFNTGKNYNAFEINLNKKSTKAQIQRKPIAKCILIAKIEA